MQKSKSKTFEEIVEEWKDYGLLIQQNKSRRSLCKFSIIHSDYKKQKFDTLEELEAWLIQNERDLAIKAGLAPRNLLAQKYAEKQAQIEAPQLETEVEDQQELVPEFEANAIAGIIEEDYVFDSEEFSDIAEEIRDVLKRSNESFYTSCVKVDDDLKRTLEALTLAEAKPFPVLVGLLRNHGVEMMEEVDRYAVSSVLAEFGFSARYFGDPRNTELKDVLVCVAASSS